MTKRQENQIVKLFEQVGYIDMLRTMAKCFYTDATLATTQEDKDVFLKAAHVMEWISGDIPAMF